MARKKVNLKRTFHQNLAMLEVDEAFLLDTLLADPEAGSFILTRVSERCALVNPHDVNILQDRLMALGHTPKIIYPNSG